MLEDTCDFLSTDSTVAARMSDVFTTRYEGGLVVSIVPVAKTGRAMVRPRQLDEMSVDDGSLEKVAAVLSRVQSDSVSEDVVKHLELALRARSEPRSEGRSSLRGGLAAWKLEKALDLMGRNIVNDVPLADVAAIIELSVAHFVRAFRRSVGTTPHRWMIERRLEISRRLLIETDLSVSDVAHRSGFFEISHFCHTFSRFTGTNPSAWRRAFRGVSDNFGVILGRD